jgi:pyruvate/2-oxoglutarate/acetoin dehydrogenase E1 component
VTAALKWDGPVIFLEPKLLSETWLAILGSGKRRTVKYDIPMEGVRGPVPTKWQPLPIGKALARCTGGDITIITVGVHRALKAAEILRAEGFLAEVLDLRTVSPLEKESICKSVSKTGRLLVIDEDYEGFGLSGELSAILPEEGITFKYARVCTQTTIPYARSKEDVTLPNVERIYTKAKELVLGSPK